MANFFISYDLMAPGQHYDRVTEAVKACGSWARIEYSLFYVSSNFSLADITTRVWNAMDANDKLIVIDTTNNNAQMRNVDPEVWKYVQSNWNK